MEAGIAFLGKPHEFAAQLAMHFEWGREFSRAIDYLICVGDTAIARCAHAEAVDRLSQALELVERVPAEQQHQRRAILYQKRATAFGGLGRWDE